MIIQVQRIDNAWHRAALGWSAAILLACLLSFVALDYLDIAPLRLWPLVPAIPQGAFLLFMLGRWNGPPTRVLGFAAIVGLFAYLPLLAALLVPAATLLHLDSRPGETLSINVAFHVLLVFWVASNVMQVRAQINTSAYVERAFRVDADRIIVDRAPATKLDTPRWKGGWWLAALLAIATPGAYLAYRLAREYAGPRGTLLQLAVVATPLAIHVLGQLARGTHLWIYLVWKLERKHGKPVHFKTASGHHPHVEIDHSE